MLITAIHNRSSLYRLVIWVHQLCGVIVCIFVVPGRNKMLLFLANEVSLAEGSLSSGMQDGTCFMLNVFSNCWFW